MFKKTEDILKRLDRLEKRMDGSTGTEYNFLTGEMTRVEIAGVEEEIEKIKAVLAEVVDYVYREGK